jgi:hypothetical protein
MSSAAIVSKQSDRSTDSPQRPERTPMDQKARRAEQEIIEHIEDLRARAARLPKGSVERDMLVDLAARAQKMYERLSSADPSERERIWKEIVDEWK